MKRQKIPLHLLMIRGSIEKKFVIRHTPWGIIMAKYPDMSKIKPSKAQRRCRNVFKEAVAWAKQVIADPVLKTAWQKKLRRRNGVYNEAVKYYMMNERKANFTLTGQIGKITIKEAPAKQPLKARSKKKHGILKKIISPITTIPNIKTCQPLNTFLKLPG